MPQTIQPIEVPSLPNCNLSQYSYQIPQVIQPPEYSSMPQVIQHSEHNKSVENKKITLTVTVDV